MRAVLLTGLLALGVAHANAGSIEYLSSSGAETSRSVTKIGCPSCFRQAQKKKAQAEMLPPGTEVKTIQVIEGEPHLVTTENWLGGNPVKIVRKATPLDIARYDPEAGSSKQIAEAPTVESDQGPVVAESETIAGGELTEVTAAPAPLVVPQSPMVAAISGTPSELVSEPGAVSTTAGVPAELNMSDFTLRIE